MRIAICNETYGDWPWHDVCRHASSVGYEGLEIAPFTLGESPTQISAAERKRIRDTAAEHGLDIVGLHWLLAGTNGLHLTSPDPDVRAKTGQYLSQLAHLCADLGGNVMVFGSPQQRNRLPGISTEQANQFARETISIAIPTLASRGVTLALEPLGPEEGDFLNTAEQAIRLCQQIDSPQVQLHLDVKAMATEAKPIPQIIHDSRDWLVHFHANDPNRQGPGMGDVDFGPIVRALRESGYDRWLSVEVFDLSPGVETLTRESIRCLRDAIAATAS